MVFTVQVHPTTADWRRGRHGRSARRTVESDESYKRRIILGRSRGCIGRSWARFPRLVAAVVAHGRNAPPAEEPPEYRQVKEAFAASWYDSVGCRWRRCRTTTSRSLAPTTIGATRPRVGVVTGGGLQASFPSRGDLRRPRSTPRCAGLLHSLRATRAPAPIHPARDPGHRGHRASHAVPCGPRDPGHRGPRVSHAASRSQCDPGQHGPRIWHRAVSVRSVPIRRTYWPGARTGQRGLMCARRPASLQRRAGTAPRPASSRPAREAGRNPSDPDRCLP